MKTFLFRFVAAAVCLLLGDALWLGTVMGSFYRSELGDLVRVSSSGGFDPRLLPTVLVYCVIPLGIVTFTGQGERRPGLRGALFGFVLYATYDLTNWSLLKGWTATLTLLDILWGTFICGLSAWAAALAEKRLKGSVR